ncbi:MAG TPA: iron-containing redox enzyme family protein [Thiolapillus brandeum]|uniref:Iron-containing redox enzyme family protein n=1 Tax=Thiolapillus brandeum TaxID=1076588 RepID=A0A831NRS6_9GAMM|nr:iron-containing redox enzyme family protein [Thiolapillus brandeum]
MNTFFEKLNSQTEQARNRFLAIEAINRGMAGDISLGTYVAFLTQAYHHVKHTVPLLMACGSRLSMEQEWLRVAIAEYIEEETGHQEWILNDIAACGSDAERVRHGMPHPSTELMVAYAYDSIHRGNPVSFFGMVLVLEGISVKLASIAAEKNQQSLGLPDAAFSYLTSHGALDVSHMQFFEKLMNRLEDETGQQAVIHMANMMYQLYGNVFDSLPLD